MWPTTFRQQCSDTGLQYYCKPGTKAASEISANQMQDSSDILVLCTCTTASSSCMSEFRMARRNRRLHLRASLCSAAAVLLGARASRPVLLPAEFDLLVPVCLNQLQVCSMLQYVLQAWVSPLWPKTKLSAAKLQRRDSVTNIRSAALDIPHRQHPRHLQQRGLRERSVTLSFLEGFVRQAGGSFPAAGLALGRSAAVRGSLRRSRQYLAC